MLWLGLLVGCPSPCVGAGCGDAFSASRVGVLTELSDLSAPPGSPTDSLLTVVGTTDQGPDWTALLVERGLLVGSPGDGAVYAFASGARDSQDTASATNSITGWQGAAAALGSSLARTSGPSGADLLVGAPLGDQQSTSRQEGLVFRFSGQGDGLTTDLLLKEADLKVYGEEPAGRFGETLVSCGDIDQDGTEDWAAAGTWDSSNQPLSGLAALALSSQLAGVTEISARSLAGFWQGSHNGARAGAALRCRDDLTGDGVPDLLIGAPFADEGGLEASGAVYLVPGPTADAPLESGPLLAARYRTLGGLTSESWLGWSLATGDLNGDGIAELVAGAPGASAGAGEVFIWDGADFQAGDDRPLLRITGSASGDGLGRSLLTLDLDGDGYDELIVGAPHHNPDGDAPSSFFSGALYIFAGAPGYQGWIPLRGADDAEVVLTVAQQFLRTGRAVTSGDFDGDGTPDLALLQTTAPE